MATPFIQPLCPGGSSPVVFSQKISHFFIWKLQNLKTWHPLLVRLRYLQYIVHVLSWPGHKSGFSLHILINCQMLRRYIYIYIYIVVSHFNRGCMYICGHWQKVLVDVCRCSFPVKFEGFVVEGRSCHVVLPWKQNVWILTNCGPASLAEKKRKKLTCMSFLCMITQEQNSSPYFTSIIGQCKWLLLWRKVVEIQKFCYHGNMMLHSPLLSRLCSKKNWGKPSASTSPSIIQEVFGSFSEVFDFAV